MPVRVLWVTKGLGPGGAESLLVASATHLRRGEFEAQCAYVLPWKDHLADRLESAGVATHCLSTRRRDLCWPWRLVRLVRSGGFDVVHVHSPLPGSIARLAARSIGRRRPLVIATEHNAWGTFRGASRWLNRLTGRWNDVTFAVSDEVRRSVRGPASRTVTTLVHGIDVEEVRSQRIRRDEMRSELGIGPHEVVIGTVANFRPQKDHPNLLAAVREALDRGIDARWVVVGQGPLEHAMRHRAAELGLGDRVVFTGFRGDAVRVMSTFDVFTLASSWEGLPVALMEAFALSLPVVATAVGGVAETVRNGVDGVLVPAGDHAALAAAWASVLTETAVLQRLAEASGRRATEFDIGRAQRIIERAYRGGRDPGPVVPPPASTARRRTVSGVDIRPAVPDDRTQVLALLERSMQRSPDPRFADLYRWKHDDNPFGASPTWVAVAGGRVVSVRAFMRWEFVRDGQVLHAVRAVDTATDPDHQGKGLFTALTEHGLEQLRVEGVDFVFNTPNSQSLPGYLKMGWREVGHLPVSVRPSGVPGLLRMARARTAADHWSAEAPVGVPANEWLQTADPTRLATPALPTRSIATRVSPEFLRWRFGLPALHYRALPVDGGAVMVRVRRRGASTELVQVARLAIEVDAGDRAAEAALRQVGADHAVRLGPPELRHGWIPLPGRGPLLVWRGLAASGRPPLSNWSLAMMDVELF